MALPDIYQRQVALLVRALPLVALEADFALKGGTAINLFIRDLPRLSVDIDLTYLPVQDRTISLAGIDAAMKRIETRLYGAFRGASVQRKLAEGAITRLTLAHDGVRIKIEVTPVLRGCVFPSMRQAVVATVQDRFGFAEMQIVSFADLYAGKIVAALDRQHPRDLFDVRALLANEGIDDALRRAFVVYLLSHDRPLSELLAPRRKPIAGEYRRNFEGMTDAPVTLAELEQAREDLIAAMIGAMPSSHREFLISFKRREPDWTLLDLPGAADLPAVRWRLENLARLEADKHATLLAALEKALAV